jgi:hypothetical protein
VAPVRRGRPPKQKSDAVETLSKPVASAPAFSDKRKLPEDPLEFDAAIRSCKVMMRPVISGISKLAEAAGTEPLDTEEKDSGLTAFSALMYQSGGMLDARTLVAMWVAGVTIPRAVSFMEKRQEAKERKAREQRGEVTPLRPPSAL